MDGAGAELVVAKRLDGQRAERRPFLGEHRRDLALGGAVDAGVGPAGQDNLHIAREIFAAWNAHDVEGFVKRLDAKTRWESDVFPAPFSGHEGARQFFKVYLTAFPDLHLDIEQILAAGDSHVVVRWRSRGTHLGPLGDIPATGRKASNRGCTVMEIKNAKAAHAWVYFDNAHLPRQIGVLPGSEG